MTTVGYGDISSFTYAEKVGGEAALPARRVEHYALLIHTVHNQLWPFVIA